MNENKYDEDKKAEEMKVIARRNMGPTDSEIDEAALLDRNVAAALHVLTAKNFRYKPDVWNYVNLTPMRRRIPCIAFRSMGPEDEDGFGADERVMLDVAEKLFSDAAHQVFASHIVTDMSCRVKMRRLFEAIEIANGRRAWTPLAEP